MVAFCLKSAFGSGHAGIHDSIHRKHKEPFLLSGNKEQKIMNKAGQFRVMVLGMWIQIISVGVLASTSYAGTKEVMSAGMIPGSAVTVADLGPTATQSTNQGLMYAGKASTGKALGEGLMYVRQTGEDAGSNDSDECKYCVENRTNSVQFVDWSDTDAPPSGTLQRFLLEPFRTHCVTKACGAPLYLVIYDVSGSVIRTVPVQDNSTYSIRYTP
jgi:hypothetical protein